MIVFDLDPGPPANILQCAQVGLGYARFSITLGCGVFRRPLVERLQIYIPLNRKPATSRRSRLPMRSPTAGAEHPNCGFGHEEGGAHE